MASTNFTTHFEIPLPLGSDLTTPMDYNTSMEAVDTALFQAQTDSTQAASLAGQANETANTAAGAVEDVDAELTLEKAKISALQTRMTNAENDITDVRADVQDSICAYNEPTATSTHHYNVGDFFFYNDTLYFATAEININDTITPNINCDTTTITAEIIQIQSEKADLSLLTDKHISLVSADGVKTWAQLITELFSTVPLTPAAFIDSTYITVNNMVFDYKGSGEYAHISTINTGMTNIAFQFILASGKYYSANGTLSVSDISDQVPTSVTLGVWKRGGSYE